MEAVGIGHRIETALQRRLLGLSVSLILIFTMSTSAQNEVLGPIINRTELVHSEKWICMKKLHWTDQRGRNRVRSNS